MAIFHKNLGGHGPLAPSGYAYSIKKKSEISLLNGEVVYNSRKLLVSTQRRELL